MIASTDRPVRFMIYADYFTRPLTGPILRSMKAIPISPSGGPKMILQAFREAGRALDAGELVCLFPEGQLTRTGVMTPFQRGLERIVKGRTTPIIPVHLDRLSNSIFSPASHRRIPKQIPLPGHRFDRRAAAGRTFRSTRSARRFESSIRRRGSTARRISGRSITVSSVRPDGTPLGSRLPTC